MKKTLVKTKIVYDEKIESLNIYFWKKSFLFFGHWYPFGGSNGGYQGKKAEKINDNSVSEVLFNNFIQTT